jgi:hypothetical protein
MLDANGATEVALDRATHVVSDTIELEGCDTLQEGVACVSVSLVVRINEKRADTCAVWQAILG